jgi:hypothetical protein
MSVAGLNRPNGSYVDRDVGAIAMPALHEFFQRKALVRGDNCLAGDAKICCELSARRQPGSLGHETTPNCISKMTDQLLSLGTALLGRYLKSVPMRRNIRFRHWTTERLVIGPTDHRYIGIGFTLFRVCRVLHHPFG